MTFAHGETLLLREPDIKGSTIVFTYGQEIWTSDLKSLQAKRITSFQGRATSPKLSPDGAMIAFTSQYAGNYDVYVVSADGGSPKQLTWHPGNDIVKGWSTDGQSVIFSSSRDSAPVSSISRFWQVDIKGSTPTPLPMLRAESGSMSPDSKHFVYQKVSPWDDGWRHYRGGQNNPLRIVTFSTLDEEKLPWKGEKVTAPIWTKDGIYYLSDINRVVNIFKLDIKSKQSEQLTHHDDYDVKNFSVDGQTIIYEQQGRLFSLTNGKTSQLKINLHADFPWAEPHWVDAGKQIESATLSPNGKRALFVARGDVFSVPSKYGDIRNLSKSASREVSAAWSRDGQKVAWFTDNSGEYRIKIADQFGKSLDEIKLAEKGFYYDLSWSHDGKNLLYSDQKQRIWWLNINTKRPVEIDQDTSVIVEKLSAAKWSPDDKWIAYVKTEANFLRNIYVYSLSAKTSYLISNNMADNLDFTWDVNGKYLYFTASTDYASKAPWLDLSIEGKKDPQYAIYAAVLNSNDDSPVRLIQSDEDEEVNDKNEDKQDESQSAEKSTPTFTVNINEVSRRIVPLPIKPAAISSLSSTENGLYYLIKQDEDNHMLKKYDFEKQESTDIGKDISQYFLADNGKAMLVQQNATWKLLENPEELEKATALETKLNLWLEPKKEWQQKFVEAWRYQRDFFYVQNIHGANWQKVYDDYSPLVQYVNHPADLTYLLDNIGAETSVGHSFSWNGKLPDIPQARVGLLGIDVGINGSYFAIDKLYLGEQWNSELSAQAPFINSLQKVNKGDLILAVDGKPLKSNANFYQAFNGTLDKQTRLTIGINGSRENTLEVWVKPIASEGGLRTYEWLENNRRYVDQVSNNQLAYIWLPDTSSSGYEHFNRYFFAQADKSGAIIDERFNNGGSIADYYIDVLNRKLSGYFNNALDKDRPLTSPGALIDGPKILLINEMAGSGGDMFPYLFRFHQIGKLVGKKTWGGLVGIWGVPDFMDGGGMTAPRSGFYNLQGNWEVENEGVAPDIEVDEDLKLASKGIDSQLKRAVEEALLELKTYKERRNLRPPPDPVKALIQ